MNKNQARFYFNLKKKSSIPRSSIPSAALNHTYFHNLLEDGIIAYASPKRGGGRVIVIKQPEKYEQRLKKRFPEGDPTQKLQPRNAIESHAYYNNSKIGKGTSETPIVFLRGNHPIHVNGQSVDLRHHTKHFSLFATLLQELHTPQLCLVENKEPFLKAEKVISQAYTFMHMYGRIGKGLLKKLKVEEILVFSDYDYVGLNEYITCKAYCEKTTFHMPDNFESLFQKGAKPLKEGREYGQKPSEQVKNSKDPLVCQLREQIARTGRFLEQEALFNHAL